MRFSLGGLIAALAGRGAKVRTLPKSAGRCPDAMGGRHVVSAEPDWPSHICLLCARIVEGEIADAIDQATSGRTIRRDRPKRRNS